MAQLRVSSGGMGAYIVGKAAEFSSLRGVLTQAPGPATASADESAVFDLWN